MTGGVAAFAAVAAIGACSNAATKEASSSTTSSPAQSTSAAPAAAHNQADMMFARMMIPHHQQAIQMSDMIFAKQGIDPRVSTSPSRSRPHRARRSTRCKVG